jgi:hypothetical protein
MYTSVVLLALTSALAHEELVPGRPAWLNDYSVASQRGLAQHRPLAVFIGTGESGWHEISKDGSLGAEVTELLASHYVCVYLDTNKKEARQLANSFAIADSVGLVLSDRSGKLQAFRHEGELGATELRNYLRRYADPERVALTTETKDDLQPRPVVPVQPTFRYAPVTRGC